MKRTIAIKLEASLEVHEKLLAFQMDFTAACNQVASVAMREKERNRVRLHHLCYRDLRKTFPKLGAHMSCNAIAKVSHALTVQKHPKELLFKKGCSVHFDKRTYSLKEKVLSLCLLWKGGAESLWRSVRFTKVFWILEV